MARIKPQALLQQSKKKKGPSRVSVPILVLYVLVVVVMGFFLFATYRHWSQRSMAQVVDSVSTEGLRGVNTSKKTDIPRYAVIHTTKGSITAELYKDSSSEVVSEFIETCKKGHFDGMQFTHVIKNFIIQGGDVERPGAIEEWTNKGKHYSQLDKSLKHEAFMLGTSKTRHDGGGFDLIITTAPIPDLNEKIDLFGRAIKGEDVIQEIEEVDTDEHYRPKNRIEILKVTLKQKL